jgi:hypothetical protein
MSSIQAFAKKRPEIVFGGGAGIVLAVVMRSRGGSKAATGPTSAVMPVAVDGSGANLAAMMSDQNQRFQDLLSAYGLGSAGSYDGYGNDIAGVAPTLPGSTQIDNTDDGRRLPTGDDMLYPDGTDITQAGAGGGMPWLPSPVGGVAAPVLAQPATPAKAAGPSYTSPTGALSWASTGRTLAASPAELNSAGIEATGTPFLARGVVEQVAARTNNLPGVTTKAGTLSTAALSTLSNVNYELAKKAGVKAADATALAINTKTGSVEVVSAPAPVYNAPDLTTTSTGTTWSASAYDPNQYATSAPGVADSRQFYNETGGYDWTAHNQARAAGLAVD